MPDHSNHGFGASSASQRDEEPLPFASDDLSEIGAIPPPSDDVAIDEIPPPLDDGSDAIAPTSGATSGERRSSGGDESLRRSRSRSRPARTDWRLGGRAVRRWREWLLGGALVSLGIAVFLGALVDSMWDSPWAPIVATAILWLAMLIPTVWALSLARPAGLFRFRATDLLFGLVLGVFLRMVQGWVDVAAGGSGAFPSPALVDGALPAEWWAMDAAGSVLVAPVVEEFFFRAVILVALYSSMRRAFGRLAAAIVSIAASTGLFMLLHGLSAGLTVDHVVSLAGLGLVCSLLVILTGRIWGAVLVHIVFNATFVALSLLGSV